MKTIETKALNSVSGAYGGWGRYGGYGGYAGYGGYGYGGWNPYAAGLYRAERAAWQYQAAQSSYLVPLTAAYLASRW